jgi:anti-sigma-K factor RskA
MTDPHANPENLDLYALGALDGEEKRSLEAHLRTCAQCRQSLAESRLQSSLLGLASAPMIPRPAVKSALMERIRQEQSPAAKPAGAPTPHRKRWGLRISLSFVAATVVLAFATYFLWRQSEQRFQRIEQLQGQLKAAQTTADQAAAAMQAYAQVVAAPDTVSVTLQQQQGGPPGQAHILFNARLGLAVYSGQVSPAPDGKSYQLWLVPSSGAPVNAGLVAANQQNGAAVVHLAPGLSAKAFAVTLEPQGGVPQPTGPKVLVGTVNG